MRPLIFPPPVEFVKTDVNGRKKPRIKLAMPSEELRCLVFSAAGLLSMHGLVPAVEKVIVQFTDTPWRDQDTPDGQHISGSAWIDTGVMRVAVSSSYNCTGATVLHEWIHLCGIIDEWTVSTMVSKLKLQVLTRAGVSVKNYYKNAAFVAHRLISYKKSPESPFRDMYNPDENKFVAVPWDYKYRNKHKG